MTFYKKTVIFILFSGMINYTFLIQIYPKKGMKNMDKDGNARRTIENSDWKNKDEKYLFELQKFLDITENITDEVLRKEIIAQMLKCDKRITQLAETIFENN